MSLQKIRKLKLFKKLETDSKDRERLQQKLRIVSSTSSNNSYSSSIATRKLNNNKKYLLEQQKTAEIERENRILFQKIKTHSHSHYHDTVKKRRSRNNIKTIQSIGHREYAQMTNKRMSIDRLRSIQQKNLAKLDQRRNQSQASFEKIESRIQLGSIKESRSKPLNSGHTPKNQKQFNQILFQGNANLDGINFKLKISIVGRVYVLAGKNQHTQILLKMELEQYARIHKTFLKGNPCNIFPYIMLRKGQIKLKPFKQQNDQQFSKIQESQNESNQHIDIPREYETQNKASSRYKQEKAEKLSLDKKNIESDDHFSFGQSVKIKYIKQPSQNKDTIQQTDHPIFKRQNERRRMRSFLREKRRTAVKEDELMVNRKDRISHRSRQKIMQYKLPFL